MRIETRTGFLMELIRRVKTGDTVPANFQRPYVWKEEDVIALWTSIINQYPLGSLLIWQPKDPGVFGKSYLGPIKVNPEKRPNLILDGQNRLITIAWSVTEYHAEVSDDAPGKDIFRNGKILVIDPYEKSVRFAIPDEIKGMIMPVHHFAGTTSAFFRQNWQSDDDDKHMEWIEDVGQNLRESRIVMTTILNATPEEAKKAFLHISRAGVPMSEEDFNKAVNFQI